MKPPITDLSSVLGLKVNTPAPQASFYEENGDPIEETSFTLAGEPEPAPVEEPTVQQLPDGAPPMPSDTGYMSAADFAENIVDLLNTIQSGGLPWLREKKQFTADELALLDGFDHGMPLEQLSVEQKRVLFKYKRQLDYAKNLPFNPTERTGLVNAVKRYAEQTQIQVTPVQGLIIAVGGVMGSRVVGAFSE